MSLYFNGGSISAGSGGGSDDTYTKAEINGLLSAKSNTGLDNLNADGQMIIDSQNGTISNCILEIPQNIKLTLENNVLTLKSGSILTKTGSTYATLTTTTDKTYTISSNQGAGKYVVLCQQGNGTIDSIVKVDDIHSGTTAQRPEDVSIGYKYFNVDTKQWNLKGSSAWNENWEICYPICVIDVDSNHVASFAKDSNGNDMIFNGAGFIGHHVFRFPNVSGFSGGGFTSDGKLNSIFYSPSNFLIQEMSSTNPSYGKKTIGFQNATRMTYIEVDTVAESPAHQHIAWVYTYIQEQNQMWVWTGGTLVKQYESPLVYYGYDGTTVTDFTIRQPYEGARDLLTDDLEKEVETKQDDVTTLTGYDSTKTQTLKNINGVLTWVTD